MLCSLNLRTTMKRPYYVHTPRNIYGDSLVHRCNNVRYEVMATHTGEQIHTAIKDRTKAEDEAKRLNDAHEVEMAHAMHI